MSATKLPWDAECMATRVGMERFLRALVCTRSHFSDSHTLAPIDKPRRVSVFFRVWVPSGNELLFLEMAGLDALLPPPRAHVGMDPPRDPLRKPFTRQGGDV